MKLKLACNLGYVVKKAKKNAPDRSKPYHRQSDEYILANEVKVKVNNPTLLREPIESMISALVATLRPNGSTPAFTWLSHLSLTDAADDFLTHKKVPMMVVRNTF